MLVLAGLATGRGEGMTENDRTKNFGLAGGPRSLEGNARGVGKRSPRFYALIAIAAALVTIGLKTLAYWLTGSVGLFSDAAESSVNLLAAVAAFWALSAAARPPDEEHTYGHSRAEYFSSALEAILILAAAVVIAVTAVV